MLMAGDDVDALFSRRLDVVGTTRVRMDQRAVGTPVFGCRVGRKDPGHATQLPLAAKQTIRLPSDRVGLLVRREREQTAKALRIGLRRLTVALVELAAARASHVRNQPIEYLATVFVEVEAVIDELAQEPTA